MAVSLTLSGVLTWVLVNQLEFASAQDQLARTAVVDSAQISQVINRDACIRRIATRCVVFAPTETVVQLVTSDLSALNPDGDRLLLLDVPPKLKNGRATRQPWVLYDSMGSLLGTPIGLGKQTTVSGQRARVGTVNVDGSRAMLAGAQLSGNRYISWVVLARPNSVVAAKTTQQFVPVILESGAVGLVLAIAVTLLLSRAFTQPLHELRGAAEDIARGNYARRVRLAGRDEIGVVGRAFNGMAEAVERARFQQRAFLANVSHELKTPLTSLIGFSQALMDGSLRTDEERTRAAAILHEEAQRVLRMSQELLDLARVESDQLTLNPHPVDLDGQLQQEIEIVRARAQARGLSIQLVRPAILSPVMADPDRLHQILENLLDNAVKYAPEGTPIWIFAEDLPGGRVLTAVTNQVGARAPDPERMFDRFYRADPSRSSAARGVGLGLAISRELALAQQGSLTAELAGDGTLSVKLELPAAQQPPAPAPEPARLPTRLAPRPQLR